MDVKTALALVEQQEDVKMAEGIVISHLNRLSTAQAEGRRYREALVSLAYGLGKGMVHELNRKTIVELQDLTDLGGS